jgi:alkanesulfonate monooxygenase SsuD/methylene tetrahydromethanopterin reductase-like flavin-dependent oxidoreductase (luciferase family)
MHWGFVIPAGDARTVAELAHVAEESGWDAIFTYEVLWGVDAWVALAAAAMRTQRIRLGTMLTPLPRRRPWDLAGQTATLDDLSGGRVILSVGLGAIHEGWTAFERDPGLQVRAELLDEGLDVLTGLWAGQPFAYEGRHYRVRPTDFSPPPPVVQRPRIPIWVVGVWPRPKSMRRAARYDGILPNYKPRDGEAGELTPDVLREIVAWVREHRAAEGLDVDSYEVLTEGVTPAADREAAAEIVRPWAGAGTTWWIEADWSVARADVAAACRRRLEAGPPEL